MGLPTWRLGRYVPGLGKSVQIRGTEVETDTLEDEDIAEGAITLSELSDEALAYADVTISTTELLALNVTPKTIVAAPASGYCIVPVGAVLFLDYNSAAYDGIAAGEDLAFKWTDKNGAELFQVETTGFLDQGSDQLRYAQPTTALVTPVAAAAVVLHLLTAEIATGDSPLKIRFYYRIVPATL